MYYGSAHVGHLYFFGTFSQTPHKISAMSSVRSDEYVSEVCSRQ
jgi:hypothetical protein